MPSRLGSGRELRRKMGSRGERSRDGSLMPRSGANLDGAPLPMAVSVAVTSAQLAPSRDRDPTAEGIQGDARRSIDDVAEAGRNGGAGKPDH